MFEGDDDDDDLGARSGPSLVDRYPKPGLTAHRWRSRSANARAAALLLLGIVVLIVVLASFA